MRKQLSVKSQHFHRPKNTNRHQPDATGMTGGWKRVRMLNLNKPTKKGKCANRRAHSSLCKRNSCRSQGWRFETRPLQRFDTFCWDAELCGRVDGDNSTGAYIFFSFYLTLKCTSTCCRTQTSNQEFKVCIFTLLVLRLLLNSDLFSWHWK